MDSRLWSLMCECRQATKEGLMAYKAVNESVVPPTTHDYKQHRCLGYRYENGERYPCDEIVVGARFCRECEFYRSKMANGTAPGWGRHLLRMDIAAHLPLDPWEGEA